MIISITGGIEVAEHTEPQERYEFLCEYKRNEIINEAFARVTEPTPVGLLARQAE